MSYSFNYLLNTKSFCLSIVVSLFLVNTSCNSSGIEITGNNTILLGKENIYNLSIKGDISLVADEQQKTATEQGYTPKTYWQTPEKSLYLPAQCVVDLKSPGNVESVSVYQSSAKVFGDQPYIRIKIFQDSAWIQVDSVQTTYLSGWVTSQINKEVQFILLEVPSSGIRFYEIMVKGNVKTGIKKDFETKKNAALPDYTARQKIGINVFNTDPADMLAPFGFVREYHNWNWSDSKTEDMQYPNNEAMWSPGNSGFEFDIFYRNLNRLDVDVLANLKENIDYYRPQKWTGLSRPHPIGADPEYPGSYLAHADHLFQFAARYGKTKVDDSLLKLHKSQYRLSGLNLVHYYETWNEQDTWWKGRDEYFSPFEYAAMISTDCDAHQQKYGRNIGLKNADPNAKMVFGGLSTLDTTYVLGVKLWCDIYRNGDLPFDVLNFHDYTRTERKGGKFHSLPPEEGKLKYSLQKVADFRDRYFPGMEVWFTEFGYDSNPGSPQGVHEIEGLTNEKVQAQWLVRSYLEILASGIDRAAVYMLTDVNHESPGLYSSCGLTTSPQDGRRKKISFYHVATLSELMKGMYYQTAVEYEDDRVRCYVFDNRANKQIRAVWSPTSSNSTVKDVIVSVPEGTKYAYLITPSDNSMKFKVQELSVKKNNVVVTASETPVYVLTDAEPYKPEFTEHKQIVLTPSNITGVEPAMYKGMIDEQSSVGDILNHQGKPVSSDWNIFTKDKSPLSVIVDLKAPKKVSRICYYDSNSTGSLSVYYLDETTGSWKFLMRDNLSKYKSWTIHVLDEYTSKLKIVKETGGAIFGELVVYEEVEVQ